MLFAKFHNSSDFLLLSSCVFGNSLSLLVAVLSFLLVDLSVLIIFLSVLVGNLFTSFVTSLWQWTQCKQIGHEPIFLASSALNFKTAPRRIFIVDNKWSSLSSTRVLPSMPCSRKFWNIQKVSFSIKLVANKDYWKF